MSKLGTIVILLLISAYGSVASVDLEELRLKLPETLGEKPPTVLIVLLVRNKEHVLPLFLTYLEQQNYPKDRLAIWLQSDHNSDQSIELLKLWVKNSGPKYQTFKYKFDNSTQRHQNESSQYDWPVARFKHLIALKEEALAYAQSIWADYIFYLDVDVFLTSPDALKALTDLRLPIVAPMLLSEGLYSNFWCGMTSNYYYQRTDEYKEIYHVKKQGVFQVPMVHSAVLIHLNYDGVRYLTFDRVHLVAEQKAQNLHLDSTTQIRAYDGPVDDIIVFAVAANSSGIPMFVSNEIPFGYILQPIESSDLPQQDVQQLINIRSNILNDIGAISPVLDIFKDYFSFPEKTTLTLDRIYMINLERRSERRNKMEELFLELGLQVEYFAAVDGKQLNTEVIKNMGIKFLPGYEDPYHHRAMTMGEIGCFLSHYHIWQRMIDEDLKEVLILEDDIRFEPYFKGNAESVLEYGRNADFELIYFGRKRLKEEVEPWVKNAEHLVHVGYSYWTLGYALTKEGARKLLEAKPLEKLLPVDEFLPLMFNRHPNDTWNAAYPVRNLRAFSAAPLLLFPTHYTGEEGYISDTEDSEQIQSLPNISNVQLKSDRELVYAQEDRMPDNNNLKITEVDESLLINLNFASDKTHQEL